MEKIKSSTYTSSLISVRDKEAIIIRRHRYDSEKESIDVHSECWTLAYADLPANAVFYYQENKWIELKGRVLIYLAPFSIVKWKVKQKKLKWVYLISQNNIEIAKMISSKVIRDFDEKIIPLLKSSKNLLTFIQNQSGDNISCVGQNNVISELKNKIDKRYTLAENIKDLINKKHNYSYISREFKKYYGLSPVKYRNNLRLMQVSYELMFKRSTILEVSQKNGINDAKFFYNQFRSLLGTNPSSFVIRKK